MIVPAFKLVNPISIGGELYDDTTTISLLQAARRSPRDLYSAMISGDVVPVDADEEWYTGPLYIVFWHRGVFTKSDVALSLHIHKKFPYIGTVRRKQVLKYLNP